VSQDGRKFTAPGVSVYLEAAAKLRAQAATASSREARMEFERLAALYEKLAPNSAGPPRPLAWQGIPFNYDRKTIVTVAPTAPGVYILWRTDRWIYIGECLDLRDRLLAHMQGDNEWITREAPRGFGFELIPAAEQRAARREALIRELTPACNPLPE
jgi:predicted GIY-YIG superfamily endonuclease